jgi:hypothetical protein
MSPWRRLVFGVYMADNPCCIQFMFIFQISLISFNLQTRSRFKIYQQFKNIFKEQQVVNHIGIFILGLD